MIKNKALRKVRWKERVCMVAIGSNVVGADDSALLDALVKEGVLSQKEADTSQSSVKDQALQSSNSYQGLVNKIQVGSWIKELNLSGDLRIRNYYTSQQQQLPAPPNVHNYDANIQRDRWRFRLRLNADFLLEDGCLPWIS
jgi:hypothetical protein